MLLNVYVKEPQQEAVACVIWMHGLGADAQDMMGLVEQMPVSLPVRHVFIDAPVRPVTLNNGMPMRAWYDIVGMQLTDREDRSGISHSEGIISQAIEDQMARGLASDQIFLAGFSQGGAMALYASLRAKYPLAGIIALSAYLPLASDCPATALCNIPVFMAAGIYDPLVLPDWTKKSRDHLIACGFQHIAWHEYPMEHSICMEEVRDLSHWLMAQVSSIMQRGGAVL